MTKNKADTASDAGRDLLARHGGPAALTAWLTAGRHAPGTTYNHRREIC